MKDKYDAMLVIGFVCLVVSSLGLYLSRTVDWLWHIFLGLEILSFAIIVLAVFLGSRQAIYSSKLIKNNSAELVAKSYSKWQVVDPWHGL